MVDTPSSTPISSPDPVRANVRPRQLCQTVDRFFQQLRRGMRVAVPTLVVLRVAQPKVRPDVDERAALRKPGRCLLRGLTRRQRREDDLGFSDVASDDERCGRAVEVRLDITKRLALLRSRGFEVLTASDGPTGVDLIREHQPHVALVDLGLPGMDGIGVIETLRARHPELKTRLVALTGYGEASDRERTRRAGFHAHLVKPATAAAIFDVVDKALDES